MATTTHNHDLAVPGSDAGRISVRVARIGIVAVLAAALALGLVSLRYGSNNDPAAVASGLIQLDR